MEVIILAGGLGTRLQSVINDIPKPMAPIREIPFLCYVLDWLKTQKVQKCVFAVGYKHECIMQYFGDTYKGINLVYSIEETPLGTGGAIKLAFRYCKGEDVFVVNGDTLFCINLNQLKQIHNGKFTMSCVYKEDASRYGLVELEGNKVVKLVEKQERTQGWINGGVYLMNKEIFDEYDGKFSLETELLPKLVICGIVNAKVGKEYFIDIGIPQDYERAKKEL